MFLQPQSIEPINEKNGAKATFQEYLGKHVSTVRAAGSEPAVIIAWARQALPEQYRPLADATITEANKHNILAVPVGPAFVESLKGRPDLILHAPDKMHPSAAGSYFYGAVVYSTIFKKSPEGFQFLGGCFEKALASSLSRRSGVRRGRGQCPRRIFLFSSKKPPGVFGAGRLPRFFCTYKKRRKIVFPAPCRRGAPQRSASFAVPLLGAAVFDLVGGFLDGAADRVEGLIQGEHHVLVGAARAKVLARRNQVDADGESTEGLVTLLRDRHFACAETIVKTAQRVDFFFNCGFYGGRTVDAVEHNLQRLGHKHLSFCFVILIR